MKLVEPQDINEIEFLDFINEFRASDDKLVPYSIDKKDFEFEKIIQALKDESEGIGIPAGWVPASTYFLIDENLKILGAVNIRHKLTYALKIEGGHIGYGIRPSVRNKRYGTKILELALRKVSNWGITQVLITCDKENIHSAGVIIRNDGKLDSEIEKDNKIVQRYWIEL